MSMMKPILPKPRIVRCDGGFVTICSDAAFICSVEAAPFDSPVYAHACRLLQETLTAQGCLTAGALTYPIRLAVEPDSALLEGHAEADAYAVRVTESGAELVGRDAGGALYAVQTFAQLLDGDADCLTLPCCEIVDWPSFPTRGLFLEDRYGSDFLDKEDWLKAIDYFAQMKLNSLTVGIYGCWCQQFDGMISEFLYVPFRKYPQLKTPRHLKYFDVQSRKWVYRENVLPTMFEEDFFGEIIAYAKERNITVKPLMNSYGHNTLIPRLLPELSAKDENGCDTGFGVCTSSDETYRIMGDLYDEIIDRYLAPNGIDAIQIGLDEVWEGIGMDAVDPFKFHTPFCKCEKCRTKERSELMIEYIIRLCHHLKNRGMRSVYIYQDMLQYEFNVLDERLAQRLRDEGLHDTVVIDWWDYAREDRLFRGKPLNSCFRSIIKSFTGYYHWSLPMEYLTNIRGCARLAQEHGFEGMEAYSSLAHCHDKSYRYLAELAWNIDTLDDQPDFLKRYAASCFPGAGTAAEHALALMSDVTDALRFDDQMGANHLFRLDYYNYTYVKADKPYPRRFPEEVFEVIHAKEEEYAAAFSRIRTMAEEALNFFESACSDTEGDRAAARMWRAIAEQYVVIADEYLGLLALEKETDADNACELLTLLLSAREGLMQTLTDTRAKGNQYMCLRIQSIYRQVLVDLLAYADACVQRGEPFHVDMEHLENITGNALRALR